MREDQVMQATLRFARETDGGHVVVHTACVRDDLPVEYRGALVTTYSESQQAVAEAAARLTGRWDSGRPGGRGAAGTKRNLG